MNITDESFRSAKDVFDDMRESLTIPRPWYTETYYALYRFYDSWINIKTWYYRIKRIVHWIQWGFNPKDIWSLDYSCAEWILPRLKKLKEIKQGIPCNMEVSKECRDWYNWIQENGTKEAKINSAEVLIEKECEAWDKIMNKMIRSFELIIEGDIDKYLNKTSLPFTDRDIDIMGKLRERNEIEIQEGLFLFAKYFRGLWD